MLEYSPTAGALEASTTLEISAKAKQMRAEGIDVAPFAAGEPDFDTPDFAAEGGIAAIRAGRTRYGPAAGNQALRDAVAAHLAATGFTGLTGGEVLIGPGAKGVLYLALSTIVRPGDEVVVPAPAWLSYAKMLQALDARAVFVPSDARTGYRIDPDALEAAVTPRTRAVLINNPGNPTGAVQPDAVLAAIGDLAQRKDLFVISDEIYEHLTWAPAEFRSMSAVAPQIHDRLLIVNGVSKAFAMTGWRIGYAGGPLEWIQRMIRLQSHATSGPPEICQAAALAALQGPRAELHAMQRAFVVRRDLMHERLSALPGVEVPLPEGAFYMLPDMGAWLGRTWRGRTIEDVAHLSRLLLDEAHAAVVPGDVFEAPTTIRFSYACGEAQIEGGLRRIERFASELD